MQTIVSLLEFFPFVLQAVKAVEDNYSAEPGATKKELVLSSVLAAAKVGESVPNATVTLISGLIDSTVTALNASGIFTHAAKTSTPAAPAAK